MDEHPSMSVEDLLGPLNEVEQKNAPALLFYAGDLLLLKTAPRVSLVGSRKASTAALKTAQSLAQSFVRLGAVVVSGLAEGIDTAAHTGAINARGRTIAVLGTSLNEAFPTKNRGLQQRIMREHLALSQFAPGAVVHRYNFPMRNRTMALVSDATVIVEASEKSGSLHQGWEALRLGRPLFILQSALEDAALTWPREFQKYGAQLLAPNRLEELFVDYLPERGRGEPGEIAF
jgi:DNA processing protein